MKRTQIWTLALLTAAGAGLVAPETAQGAAVVVQSGRLRIDVIGPAHHARRGYGELHVNVEPERARVFIDGRYIGRGDTTRVLHAGRHSVRVVLRNGREAAETVHVAAGQLTRAHLDLY